MSADRFYVQLQEGKDADETASRTMQELIRLTNQLNAAKVPISVGPNDSFPEGLQAGQPVLDWSSGISILKVWNGQQLV